MSFEKLPARMRPETLDEIVGQDHILRQGSLLYNMIASDNLSSIILYGPPGTGKTTIAYVISKMTKADFHKINAVAAGKKDIEAVCVKAEKNKESSIRTILFIDEIHRFNKAQQDYLLPFVEDNTVTLIGATTENPFFEVIPALISRSVLFTLNSVSEDDIKNVIIRALNDTEKGLGNNNQTIDDDALSFLAIQANGDVRYALSILELASINAYQKPNITINDVSAVIQKPHLNYDKDGDKHYDNISAFIKSMRGSDPDATLYYLAKMIEAGEDPKFIARRIMVHASEDVGNADPLALIVAEAAASAVERVGLPEGRIILAQAALHVALAPKSNSVYNGIDSALEYVRQHPIDEIPSHLCDDHYKSAYKLGHGVGYLYPHDYLNHWVSQRYLPQNVNEQFYKSDFIGYQQSQDRYRAAIMNQPNQPNTRGVM